jgi:hypothetical protein
MTNALNELLPTTEATHVIGVSAERLRQLAVAGTIPSISTPLGRLYAREALEQYVAERGARRARSAIEAQKT